MKNGKRGPTPPRVWQPMYRCELKGWTQAHVAAVITNLQSRGMSDEEIKDFLREEDPDHAEAYKNDKYLAIVDRHPDGHIEHVSFRRNDRGTVHDWRDIQRIKNDICGEEAEAIELYPAESRVVDTANQYHLWVARPGERIPVGFRTGYKIYDAEPVPNTKARQRPQ